MRMDRIPDFSSYEEEAEFWDSLDTADLMVEGGEWLHFETPEPRAVRVAQSGYQPSLAEPGETYSDSDESDTSVQR